MRAGALCKFFARNCPSIFHLSVMQAAPARAATRTPRAGKVGSLAIYLVWPAWKAAGRRGRAAGSPSSLRCCVGLPFLAFSSGFGNAAGCADTPSGCFSRPRRFALLVVEAHWSKRRQRLLFGHPPGNLPNRESDCRALALPGTLRLPGSYSALPASLWRRQRRLMRTPISLHESGDSSSSPPAALSPHETAS